MNITIVQQCDRSNGWQQLRDLTWPVTRRYCDQHRYRLLQQESADRRGRHPSWGKIQVILDAFRSGAMFVLWLDTDACIINPHVRLEDIIKGRERFHVLLTVDFNGINNGVVIWKKSLWTFHILNQMLTTTPTPLDIFHEQSALMRLIGTRGELEPKHVSLVPKRQLNSYHKPAWFPHHWPCYENDYQPGDFVLHGAGFSVAEKLRLFESVPPQA